MTPGYRIWLHVDGVRMFGPGTHELLRHVDETGSLHRAAKLMGMSYTKAWHLLRETEEHLGWRWWSVTSGAPPAAGRPDQPRPGPPAAVRPLHGRDGRRDARRVRGGVRRLVVAREPEP